MEILASGVFRLFVAICFVAICILLIVVILLQKGRGGGLAGAFGGAGGHSAFGAKTGDVFTWITIALTTMFVLVAIVGNFAFVPESAADPTPVVAPVGSPEPGGATPAKPVPVQTGGTTQPAK